MHPDDTEHEWKTVTVLEQGQMLTAGTVCTVCGLTALELSRDEMDRTPRPSLSAVPRPPRPDHVVDRLILERLMRLVQELGHLTEAVCHHQTYLMGGCEHTHALPEPDAPPPGMLDMDHMVEG